MIPSSLVIEAADSFIQVCQEMLQISFTRVDEPSPLLLAEGTLHAGTRIEDERHLVCPASPKQGPPGGDHHGHHRGQPGHGTAAMAAGADGYLARPYTADKLEAKIARVEVGR